MRPIEYFYEIRGRAEARAREPRRIGKVLRGTNISLSLGLIARDDVYKEHGDIKDYAYPVHKNHLRG